MRLWFQVSGCVYPQRPNAPASAVSDVLRADHEVGYGLKIMYELIFLAKAATLVFHPCPPRLCLCRTCMRVQANAAAAGNGGGEEPMVRV